MAAGKYQVLQVFSEGKKNPYHKTHIIPLLWRPFFQHLHTYARHLYKAVGIYNFNGICSLIVPIVVVVYILIELTTNKALQTQSGLRAKHC